MLVVGGPLDCVALNIHPSANTQEGLHQQLLTKGLHRRMKEQMQLLPYGGALDMTVCS